MEWIVTEDLDRYLAEAGEFLRADPVGNTVLLSVAETLRLRGTGVYGGKARFGWWQGPDVRAVFQHTAPLPVFLSAMPEEAARALATVLTGPLSGVNGAPEAAGAFTETWGGGEVTMRERLHRLARLEPPSPFPPGTARVALSADRDLVLNWYQGFQEEVHSAGSTSPALVEDKISYGGVVLWEVEGTPVSMAARTRTLSNTARVAPVYTPPEHRRHGYGTAATVALTRSALNAGAQEVVLFTDLANPTSNGIYRRLGYVPVGDRVLVSFP